jgi:hypothetical protein
MSEEEKSDNIKSTIDAVTGLAKAIPVYEDAIQPAAKQLGQSLEVVAKSVNLALAPIKALVWGYDQIEDFISKRVSQKLKNVPKEDIVSPPPQVAGPAVESLKYAGHDTNLRELYANLLANAMDKKTTYKSHPGFVEVLRNFSSEEAVLIQAFTKRPQWPLIDIHAAEKNGRGYFQMYTNHSHLSKNVQIQHPELIPTYLDNLCRLGILEIPTAKHIPEPNTYEPLENDSALNSIKNQILSEYDRRTKYERKLVRLTDYGRLFIENVVVEKDQNR